MGSKKENIMSQLRIDNAIIRENLIEIMGRLSMTYDTACAAIGISKPTLVRFILYKVSPQLRTMYKIKKFITQNSL